MLEGGEHLYFSNAQNIQFGQSVVLSSMPEKSAMPQSTHTPTVTVLVGRFCPMCVKMFGTFLSSRFPAEQIFGRQKCKM